MLTNREIADTFHAIADALEIQGEDRYRFLSYRRVGDTLAELPEPLSAYAARGELEDLPGVGKVMAAKIGELLDTGRLDFYERIKAELPAGVLELLRVPDVGPRTAGRLYRELNITSLDALREAAEQGRLRGLKGFGAKTEQKILEGIAQLASGEERMLLGQALETAERLLADLQAAAPAVERAAYAGSLRRGRSTIGDIDLLAASDDGPAAIEALAKLPSVARVDSAGSIKATVFLQNGRSADLLVIPPARWGSALQHFTGSQAHSIAFRELAKAQGFTFSENGFRREDGSLVECADEEAVYALLGLPYIPPELREDQGEFAAARAGTLPDLVELADIRADLHLHSTWSDGKASIAAMAEAAQARGYSHMAITDHGAYLGVTGGLTPERALQQTEEVAQLNASFAATGSAFRILHGVEVDITPEGTLALPDELLAQLDIVVASPHVSLRQERAKATARLVRAIEHPHVDIIGHPTGRLLNRRSGSDLELEPIFEAAAATGTALEINSGPDRLDLDAPLARRALELGVTLAVDSDAHGQAELDWMRLGVITARRAWASPERIVNCWGLDRLQQWLGTAKGAR
jgi:DNA polymerase (family X)